MYTDKKNENHANVIIFGFFFSTFEYYSILR